MPALVFDLGGTHLRSGVAVGGVLSRLHRQRVGSFVDGLSTYEVWCGILDSMLERCSVLQDHLPRESPLVFAFPGPISRSGQILSAPTLFGDDLNIPDVAAELRRATGRDVFLLNDISAAAWHFSGIAGSCRFLVVTISSGIGSKMFDPDCGVLDDMPYGGEIGHSQVDRSEDALWCDCGGKGHLGAIASGRGIERAAKKRASEDPQTFASSHCCRTFGATPDTLENERHIIPSLHCRDPWTIDLIRHCSNFLAQVLVTSILVAGLEKVFLIGGFALAGGEHYLKIVRDAVSTLCDYAILRESIAGRIELGAISEEACLMGAGRYAQVLASRVTRCS